MQMDKMDLRFTKRFFLKEIGACLIIHTDMDIVLRRWVVAVTMVLVPGSKLATVDFGCHDMDDSAVDQP